MAVVDRATHPPSYIITFDDDKTADERATEADRLSPRAAGGVAEAAGGAEECAADGPAPPPPAEVAHGCGWQMFSDKCSMTILSDA